MLGEYAGTGWLCSRRYALTAAHCVGNRVTRHILEDLIRLQFPWGEVGAKVASYDFDLDAALLAVTDDIPMEATIIEIGALPNKTPWPQGTDALGWHSYSYPIAHPTGMTLTGVITSREGNVEGSPAAELLCSQGGEGSLEGSSGAPVCYGNLAFGLVRFGPPLLRQRVIHAVLIESMAQRFPEIDTLMTSTIARGRTSRADESIAFLQVKIDTLANRLALLTEEYIAISEQLSNEIDEVKRVRLRRRAGNLEDEIGQLETELDGLR